jgi:hypothetical protein
MTALGTFGEEDDITRALTMRSGNIPQVMDGLVRGLGRYAPPGVAGPMLRAGLAMGGVTEAFMRGQRDALQNKQLQMELNAFSAKQKLDEMLRDYAESYEIYGPLHDGEGNIKRGAQTDKLRESLREKAQKHQDWTLYNALAQKDLSGVEQYMRYLQDHGNDLDALTKRLRIEQLKEGIAARERKKADEDAAYAPYYKGAGTVSPGGGGGSVGTPPTSDRYGPPPEDTKNDPGLFEVDPMHPPGETPKPAEPSTGPESSAAPGPAEGVGAPGSTPDRPVRLAMADTGVMSDAPSPGFGPPAEKVAAGAMSGTDPIRPSGSFKPETWEPPPSRAMNPESMRAPNGRMLDPDAINGLALRLVNGAIRVAEFSAIPKPIRNLAVARATEIESDMDALAKSPLTGRAAYEALNKINPQFANTLPGYVKGDFAVPASAWKSPEYLNHIVELGRKLDPTFNANTFKLRYSTKLSYASGKQALNMLSIATLDIHAGRAIGHLNELKTYLQNKGIDPNSLRAMPALMGGQSRFGNALGYNDPVLRSLEARIDADLEVVATEHQRAISNAAPHVGPHDVEKGQLDYKMNTIDAVIDQVIERQGTAHDRMGVLVRDYKSKVGLVDGQVDGIIAPYAKRVEETAVDTMAKGGGPDINNPEFKGEGSVMDPLDTPEVRAHAKEMMDTTPIRDFKEFR